MKKVMMFILAMLLLLPTAAKAQEIHLSAGLMNVGQLSEETTNHVRFGGNGHDVYMAASIEGELSDRLNVYFKGTYMPTFFFIWPCNETPCEKLSRWEYRPSAQAMATSVSLSQYVIGLNFKPVKDWVEVTGGVGLMLVHGADYRYWGGVPMAVEMYSSETRLKLPIQKVIAKMPNVGLEVGVDYIPAHQGKSRFIVIDEFAGSPGGGRKFEIAQRNWTAIRLGANVAVH